MVANNFILIINQTDFCLAYYQKEKSRYDNIPFNFKGIRCIEYFPTKDIQTPPPQFDPVFTDDAKCAETNEISIFRVMGLKKIGVRKLPKITITRKI